MKKITGYLVDVEHRTAGPVTIEKSLESYYKILNCDCIDIARRVIGSKKRKYEIICDDKALLKDSIKISAFTASVDAMLCGNLFVVKFDGIDDVISLDNDDIEYLKRYTNWFETSLFPKPYPALVCVEYR